MAILTQYRNPLRSPPSPQSLDPFMVLIGAKCIEIFAEAIPGVIIQLTAIATSKEEITAGAWVSLLMSALSTGFLGASISYDADINPKKRKSTPSFYGYIPSKAR